jgi:hypothetical protein
MNENSLQYLCLLLIKDQIAKMASTVTGMFPRLHGLIIGCGLGRNEIVNKIVSIIISEAVAANLP